MIDLSTEAARRRSGVLRADVTDDDALRSLDARMLWSALIEPGDGVAGALIAAYGPRAALEIAVGARELPSVRSDDIREGRRRWMARVDEATTAVARARAAGVMPLTPEDESWPRRLDDLGVHAPVCLWWRGSAEVLRLPRSVALVGARASTAYGEHVTAELAAGLAGRGAVVVSGAAYGIDAVGHRNALLAEGPTVAWLAGGVDRPYPAGNRHLIERIVGEGGAVVAEVPCGASPTKWRFLARNRLIAASSVATVVVEAGWRSGSLNTAGHAAQLGRPLGAVPGPVTSAASAGCHRLLREYGAQCVTGVDDVLELMGSLDDSRASDAREVAAVSSTDPADRLIAALNATAPRGVAELSQRTGLRADEVSAALGLLALEGRVAEGPKGWRRASR
ncbi:DNA-processing protein DprA [Microbacterium sp. TNHR37B]|uniref:DNA-processing protein DprA n=1 Tax=Microbacterium sp. TNHR37B TaxID=1775956 RepID=UPI0007B1C59C|nr:DNA-processing protein DprA [Microbacterium sp. TNHR37B]KZE91066.1 hypothetical protein AVP41_00599 [Microbacterium sp. TNHR37B]